MDDTTVGKFCLKCDLVQTGDSVVCSHCSGPLNRRVNINTSDSMEVHDSVQMKQRRPGIKKPLMESVQGDFYHRGSGTWSKIEQVVDRTINPPRYRKRVIGADGKLYKDVDGLLSDQSLHGPQKDGRSAGTETELPDEPK